MAAPGWLSMGDPDASASGPRGFSIGRPLTPAMGSVLPAHGLAKGLCRAGHSHGSCGPSIGLLEGLGGCAVAPLQLAELRFEVFDRSRNLSPCSLVIIVRPSLNSSASFMNGSPTDLDTSVSPVEPAFDAVHSVAAGRGPVFDRHRPRWDEVGDRRAGDRQERPLPRHRLAQGLPTGDGELLEQSVRSRHVVERSVEEPDAGEGIATVQDAGGRRPSWDEQASTTLLLLGL